ncbi:phage tail protein [Desulfocurvus vexinensis]|uniref:phage tail protein n=1 Tax=Desulfocurvus vexinensis TaxID=399548 RepID=UPI0004ADEE4F|nr:phage tail protein [Desulfocurvus vexinensis]
MTNYFGLVTRAGHGLIAAALAGGTTVQLTHIALGDGGGAPVSPTEGMTALVNEVHRAPINTLEQDAENPALMWAEVVLPAGVGGWYVREAGVLDADGTLVAVASTPESYKPLLAEGSGSELALKLPLVLTNTATVTLKIDPTVVLASREHVAARVAAHNVAPDTHADLRALAAAAGGVADAHAGRRDNPHEVTAAQVVGLGLATATAPGLVELATTAEAQAGTDTSRAVTPAGLAAALAAGQRVRAWVAFDASGGVVTVLGSYNVSSVTRTAAGKFDITFQTAMPDANYAAVQACRSDASSANRVMTKVVSVSAGVFSGAWGGDDSDGTWFDQPYNSLVVVQ